MNLTFRQLKAVTEIARLRSITRAAEHLHITQQGLSLLLREVETQLDCRLFDRTTRSLGLTEAGRRFIPVAEQTVRTLEVASAELGTYAQAARRTLSVAATPLVAASLLPEACTRFRTNSSEVDVRLYDVERVKIQQLVEAGEVDVGFGAFFKPAATLHRKLIFSCDLVCFSPPDTGSLRNHAVGAMKWKELRDRPLLALPADNDLQQLVDAHLARIGRANENRATYRNMMTILSMVEAGFGSAVLPSFAISMAQRMSIGVSRLLDPVAPVDFFQINAKGRAAAVAQESFVEALVQTMQARCMPAISPRRPTGTVRSLRG